MKKIVIFAIILSFVLSMFAFTPMTAKAGVKEVYQVGVIGVMPQEYVGAMTLELANTYEDDFKSNYSYPMQGMTFTENGELVICDTSYGRVHVFDENLVNQFTFGELGKGPGMLQYPVDVAVDMDGNFYVADFFNNYWAKFDKDGNWILNAGTEGSGDGEFNGPSGIAVDGSDNVYVSDQMNHRVEVFDTSGNFKKVIASGTLSNPGGMCLSGNDLLVVDMNKCIVHKLDSSGNDILSFGGKGGSDGEFVYPFDVAVDADDNIYVVDRGLGNPMHPVIEKFDSKGEFLMNFGSRATAYPQPNGSFYTPAGVAVNAAGSVFAYDAGYFHEVGNPFGYPLGTRLTEFAVDGSYVQKIDFDISAEGRLMNPIGAAIDSKGNIWVTSWGNFSDAGEVIVFKEDGTLIKKMEGISETEYFNAMGGIITDGIGFVYIGTQHYIAKFDENWNFVTKIGEGKVTDIAQMAFDSKGNIWCASNGTQTIAGFKPNGTFISQFTTTHAPTGFAIDGSGNFYFTTTDDNKVYKYGSDGTLKKSFSGAGRGEGRLWIPYGAAVSPSGEILVADTENGRIQAFDSDGNFLWRTDRFLYEPVNMNFGPDGKLYVADCFHNVVRILSFTAPEQKNYDFRIVSSVENPMIYADDSKAFNIVLENRGNDDDDYAFSIESSFPSGWSISDFPESGSLLSGKRLIIPITVSVSSSAKPYDTGYFTTTVVSQGDTTLVKKLIVTVTVPEKPPVSVKMVGDMIPMKESTAIPVMVGAVENLYGVSIVLGYDPNLMTVEKVVQGTLLGEDALFIENHSKPGIINIGYTLVGSAAGKTGLGEVAKIYFKGVAEGKTTIQINEVLLKDAKGKDIPVEANNLNIEVVNPVPPSLTVNIPAGETVDSSYYYFSGKTDPDATVTVNGKAVTVKGDGSFTGSLYLKDGSNMITVVATNKYDLSKTVTKTVTLSTATVITLQPDNPMMSVNGVQQEIDPGRGTKPLIISSWGRTVVPIRAIVETLGGTIGWESATRKVTINLKGTVIELWIDNPKAKVNGTEVWIDEGNHNVKPIIRNDRTMLPLRFVTESLGAEVGWEDTTKTITITYPKP